MRGPVRHQNGEGNAVGLRNLISSSDLRQAFRCLSAKKAQMPLLPRLARLVLKFQFGTRKLPPASKQPIKLVHLG